MQAQSDVSNAAWVPQKRLRDFQITEGTLAVIERAFEKIKHDDIRF